MSDQHTPGPWHCTVEPDGFYELRVASGAWVLRCESASNPSDEERKEDEANVRLIAAAPEMLALLQCFERFSAGTGFVYPLGSLQELQTLISKATGSAT